MRLRTALRPGISIAQSGWAPDQLCEAALDLLFIDIPVAQAGVVIVALAEPPVIHDDHFDAHSFGSFCDLNELFIVEVKEGCFPGVDQDGAPHIADKLTFIQIVPDKVVVVLTHPGQTLVSIGHEHGGSVKVLTGIYRVAEQAVVDAHYQAGLVVLVKLDLCQKASRIHERKAIAGTEIFGRRPLRQGNKGVLLVRGYASAAADLVHMVSQRLTLNLPLLTISARQGDQIQILSVHVVHVQRHDPLELDRFFSSIMDSGCAHDDVRLLKDGIQECDLDIGHRILNGQFQTVNGVVFCGKGSGQPLQGKGTMIHPVGNIPAIEGEAAVRILHFDGIDPEISLLLRRELLGLSVQREGALLQRIIGVARKTPVILPDQIDQILVPDRRTVVEVLYIVEIPDLQLIGRPGGMEGKGLFVFVIHNCHGELLFLDGGAAVLSVYRRDEPSDRHGVRAHQMYCLCRIQKDLGLSVSRCPVCAVPGTCGG